MQTISEDTAQKVLAADLNNIKKKVKAGKTLTSSERALFSTIANKLPPGTGSKDGRAKNKAELARILAISRQRLQALSKKEGFPKPDESGAYDVAACIEFISETKAGKNLGFSGKQPLRDAILKEQLRKLRFNNDVEERKYILAEEVKEDVNRMATKLKTVLYARMESDLPPILEGMSAPDIQVELRKACNEVLQQISTEPWD